MSQQDDGTETHLPGLFMGRTNQPAAYPVALVSRQHGNGGQRQRSCLFSAIRNDFHLCQQDVPRKGALLEKTLRNACEAFVETREKEGENLKTDLLNKLDEMIGYVDFIEERSPIVMKEYRERLETKVKEILEDKQMDDARIATEVTIFADKICVDEETVRLKSHIEAMKAALTGGGTVGRKLDFIAQEMNREANTILSKASDLAISDTGINLKTDIEKVREQIQNIE